MPLASVFIRGEPRALGRPRTRIIFPKDGRKPFVHVHPMPEDEAAIAWVAKVCRKIPGPWPVSGPIEARIRFVLPMRQGEIRKRTRVPMKWADTQAEDIDNLQKLLFDGITAAGWWADDRCVVRVIVEKVRAAEGEESGTHLSLESLPPLEPPPCLVIPPVPVPPRCRRSTLP